MSHNTGDAQFSRNKENYIDNKSSSNASSCTEDYLNLPRIYNLVKKLREDNQRQASNDALFRQTLVKLLANCKLLEKERKNYSDMEKILNSNMKELEAQQKLIQTSPLLYLTQDSISTSYSPSNDNSIEQNSSTEHSIPHKHPVSKFQHLNIFGDKDDSTFLTTQSKASTLPSAKMCPLIEIENTDISSNLATPVTSLLPSSSQLNSHTHKSQLSHSDKHPAQMTYGKIDN